MTTPLAGTSTTSASSHLGKVIKKLKFYNSYIVFKCGFKHILYYFLGVKITLIYTFFQKNAALFTFYTSKMLLTLTQALYCIQMCKKENHTPCYTIKYREDNNRIYPRVDGTQRPLTVVPETFNMVLDMRRSFWVLHVFSIDIAICALETNSDA